MNNTAKVDNLSDYGIENIRLNAPYYLIGADTVQVPDSTISQSDLIRQKHLANTFSGLTWSLNYHTARLQTSIGGSWNTYTGNHFGSVIWSQFTANSEINHEWYRSKALKTDFNIYTKAEYLLAPNLHVPGPIYNTGEFIIPLKVLMTTNAILPRSIHLTFLTKSWFIVRSGNANQNIYASVSVANREPNRDNFVDADPTKPAPTPERLYDAEAGYTYNNSNVSLSNHIICITTTSLHSQGLLMMLVHR
ncbi:MAG: hypothetical protein U0Z17_03410 [Bacteroidales bacterium]